MKSKLLNSLKENKIEFEEVLHSPVFTCEDADNLELKISCTSCKNLFLTCLTPSGWIGNH